MNKISILVIFLLFLGNCSSSKNPINWKKKQIRIEEQQNVKKAFTEDRVVQKEFNSDLRLDLSNIVLNNKTFDNKNNLGSQNYDGLLNKVGNYKFSKLIGFNQLNFKPTFFYNEKPTDDAANKLGYIGFGFLESKYNTEFSSILRIFSSIFSLYQVSPSNTIILPLILK